MVVERKFPNSNPGDLHRIQYQLAMLNEQLYPQAQRERDRDAGMLLEVCFLHMRVRNCPIVRDISFVS